MEDSSKMKTPVTVLQEIMTKMGLLPEYELVAQTGPAHSTVFEFRCMAYGVVVVGSARSKKEAKQQAARLMLNALSRRGVPVPPSHAASPAAAPAPAASAAPTAATCATAARALPGATAANSASASDPAVPEARTHVALLRELCEQYNLGTPDYDLVSDTGPAHMREFRQRARVGAVFREASASTKKQARQDAARQLYAYLRVHLARLTTDFVEEEALARAHERTMERYAKLREDSAGAGGGAGGGGWRPDLGQRIADYHLGLATHTDVQKRAEALRAVESSGGGRGGGAETAETALAATCAALDLTTQWSQLERGSAGPLTVVTLEPGAPPLVLAGADRAAAARAALRCLTLALRPRPPASPSHSPSPSPLPTSAH